MDSINRNQPEHNREDLSGREAIAKIKDLVSKSNVCFSAPTLRPENQAERGQ